MPFLDIWIHAVWATYERRPLLVPAIRNQVFTHIKDNARQKGVYVDRVNGYHDHVHALFSLTNDITISKVIQLLKGESSYWINKNQLIKNKFEWQSDYYAVSVSESQLKYIQDYIDRQEDHHRSVLFTEEYSRLLQALGQPKS